MVSNIAIGLRPCTKNRGFMVFFFYSRNYLYNAYSIYSRQYSHYLKESLKKKDLAPTFHISLFILKYISIQIPDRF